MELIDYNPSNQFGGRKLVKQIVKIHHINGPT